MLINFYLYLDVASSFFNPSFVINLLIHLITSTTDQSGSDVVASTWSIRHFVRVSIRSCRVKAGDTSRICTVGVLLCVVGVACLLSLVAAASHTTVTTSNGSINSQQPPPASSNTKYEPLDSTCCKYTR